MSCSVSGEGLNNKRIVDSISAPITFDLRLNETAGLGSNSAGNTLSMDNVQSKARLEKWTKAAKRYQGLPTTSFLAKTPVGSTGKAFQNQKIHEFSWCAVRTFLGTGDL